MASSNLVFLLILVSFLYFATSKAQDLGYFASNCLDGETVTANSSFRLNLRTLLFSLSSKATSKFEFYNNTITGSNPSDTVYGLFMCRGDIPSQLCGQCVLNAIQNLSSYCFLNKQAVIWYDECMVRYSNHSFFSNVEKYPIYAPHNVVDVSNYASFMRLLLVTMNETADEATNSSFGAKKYAAKEASVSAFQKLYCLAQCTQDLSPQDCRTCLAVAIGEISSCCDGKQGGRVVSLSCYIRYEVYPFYRSTTALEPASLVPATNSSNTDSKYSEDPGYLSHNCSRKTFPEYGYLSQILEILFSSLRASGRTDFHTEATDDTSYRAYGHFMCRGDIPHRLCHQCVLNATVRIASECGVSEEGIIWYNHCLLRYSYRPFSSTVDTSPRFEELNITNISNQSREQNLFSWVLGNALSRVITDASRSFNSKYATKSVKLNDLQTLYTLAQCTADLSTVDCERCLCDLMGSAIPWHRLGSVGGRVIYPSCNARFELFQFYRDGVEASLPPPGPRGTQLQKLLNWSQRYQIIGGIAREILYLHEYSRLKIIYRDLKPSNILLDENINPKIADFGMARIIEIDQDQGSTHRIVGTYGYMSPEYAMLGQFSEKSDVYSFGVMVLEIITGIKNVSSYDSYHIADGLISYVWRLWRDETPLSVLDPNMKENCSQIEVIKGIQIGLLCVQENPDTRPTMATVVSYLNSFTIELPSPQQPAFFMHSRMYPIELAQESSSNQSANEMSISKLLPR